jgi:hypothetical protein
MGSRPRAPLPYSRYNRRWNLPASSSLARRPTGLGYGFVSRPNALNKRSLVPLYAGCGGGKKEGAAPVVSRRDSPTSGRGKASVSAAAVGPAASSPTQNGSERLLGLHVCPITAYWIFGKTTAFLPGRTKSPSQN